MLTNSSLTKHGVTMEAKTAQIRAKNPATIHSEPAYVTPTRARFLIETGAFELVNAPGPTQRQVAGPSETKPMEPTEKKSYADATGGPLTDSVQSSEPGPDASASYSAEAPASQEGRPILSVKRGPGRPRKEV